MNRSLKVIDADMKKLGMYKEEEVNFPKISDKRIISFMQSLIKRHQVIINSLKKSIARIENKK